MNYNLFKVLIFFISILVSNLIIGQEIDFNKLSILEVKAYENNQNSTPIDTLEDFGILKNPHFDVETLVQAKAFIFKRNDDDFEPQLHVWYFYDKALTELKGKNYYWGLYNPDFNDKGKEEWLIKLSNNEKGFKEKYNQLEKILSSKLGQPIKKRTIADNEKRFIENMFWEDDKKIVGLSINFDRKINKIPGIGIFAKFEIEVQITYK